MTTQPHEHHHPIRDELKHLHDVAEKGDSGETPFILIGGLMLYLVPIVCVVTAAGLLLYYFV
jgi:hypothetical protein